MKLRRWRHIGSRGLLLSPTYCAARCECRTKQKKKQSQPAHHAAAAAERDRRPPEHALSTQRRARPQRAAAKYVQKRDAPQASAPTRSATRGRQHGLPTAAGGGRRRRVGGCVSPFFRPPALRVTAAEPPHTPTSPASRGRWPTENGAEEDGRGGEGARRRSARHLLCAHQLPQVRLNLLAGDSKLFRYERPVARRRSGRWIIGGAAAGAFCTLRCDYEG